MYIHELHTWFAINPSKLTNLFLIKRVVDFHFGSCASICKYIVCVKCMCVNTKLFTFSLLKVQLIDNTNQDNFPIVNALLFKFILPRLSSGVDSIVSAVQ